MEKLLSKDFNIDDLGINYEQKDGFGPIGVAFEF